ncbi:mechanosensitive ion channel [Niabella sp. W65]|nr:mechanosensitive ion channel [Niabella sp. W65]MCH7365922.1 mechanosensitive ion channel [Niabella sp. W65]ULT41669.1 mechanosensitive ion channel [Niabella sp. I65]
MALTVLLLLSVFEMIGVKITAFAALLAGAGLAVGAALNGSLGNFAGGVMMLLFKPFKVGI